MRAMSPQALALVPLLALLACDTPDVGQRCVLTWNQSWEEDGTAAPPTPDTATGDYFETGNVSCDNLVCIVSPAITGSKYATCSGDACGYCSKPCVSNKECYTSKTQLVCDTVVLDDAFIATLDDATRVRYLGDVTSSYYCVVQRAE
jgi:hypothetical protein